MNALPPTGLLAGLLIACTSTNPATNPAEPPATSTEASDSPTVSPSPRAFQVRVVGQGRPVILIPGLGCSGDVWRGAEARFAGEWQMHIVTIAGFGGAPPIEPPLLETVRTELIDYIARQGLAKPVLIGHSLGAYMALAVAGSAPDATGPVIALDGAPYGPALADPAATPDAMRPRAELLRRRAAAVTDGNKDAQARMMYGPMVTAESDLAWILEGVFASDKASIGQAMFEMLTTDSRPRAAAIRARILTLVAGHRYEGDSAPDLSHYRAQLPDRPDVIVEVVPRARHFVMVDQPDHVYDRIRAFLGPR